MLVHVAAEPGQQLHLSFLGFVTESLVAVGVVDLDPSRFGGQHGFFVMLGQPLGHQVIILEVAARA